MPVLSDATYTAVNQTQILDNQEEFKGDQILIQG